MADDGGNPGSGISTVEIVLMAGVLTLIVILAIMVIGAM